MGAVLPRQRQNFFFEIARCANVRAHFEETPTVEQQRCHDVIVTQKAATLADFQIPEPWCGDIEWAPILFVSSNPSINEQSSAFGSEPDSELWDMHVNLFFDQRWSREGIYTVAPDGERSTNWVRYWAGARARAAELLRRAPNAERDYALTEVVHCKSRDEDGVMSALPECARRYLRRVLALSSAHVLVIFGDTAWRSMSDMFGISGSDRVSGPLEIEGHKRMVLCLPHPNARKARSVRALIRGRLESDPRLPLVISSYTRWLKAKSDLPLAQIDGLRSAAAVVSTPRWDLNVVPSRSVPAQWHLP